MKEKVLSLAKGNFTYEKPELRVNPQQLTGKVSAGGSLKCVMTVENSRGTKVKGFGSTMDPEVHFLPVFHGVHNELEVEFESRGGTCRDRVHCDGLRGSGDPLSDQSSTGSDPDNIRCQSG